MSRSAFAIESRSAKACQPPVDKFICLWSIPHMKKNPAIKLMIERVGSASELARRLRISKQAISKWREIPLNRVYHIEQVTGIKREVLRPDIWPVWPT